jgi:Cdc6-like AAA superfamily ATPase
MKEIYLSHFTPSMMNPEALESIFVQRQKLAEHVVETIRDSVLTPAKHYTLLMGPRGIGKTHFVSLVYHRIQKMDDLRDRLLIAWLREEEWGVTSFLDLLLRIFDALKRQGINGDLSTELRHFMIIQRQQSEQRQHYSKKSLVIVLCCY